MVLQNETVAGSVLCGSKLAVAFVYRHRITGENLNVLLKHKLPNEGS